MTVKLLIEHHLEFLSLKRGCTGSSESINVKMPHRWKSHFVAHLLTWYFGLIAKETGALSHCLVYSLSIGRGGGGGKVSPISIDIRYSFKYFEQCIEQSCESQEPHLILKKTISKVWHS